MFRLVSRLMNCARQAAPPKPADGLSLITPYLLETTTSEKEIWFCHCFSRNRSQYLRYRVLWLEKLEVFDTKRAYCNLATTSKENTHRNANFGLHRLGKECQKNVMGFPYHGRRTEDSCTTPSRHPVCILEMNIKVN